jgi:aspartate-semialdehyde dehydrogenase
MKVAVVGASGLVGSVMLQLLEERNFPVSELIPVASSKSVGKSIRFKGKDIKIISDEVAISKKPNLALFSAGGASSLELAPKFAATGSYVIDNSSAWRMNPDIKLIVPEINGYRLNEKDFIIANPNCSTIQMVMVLAPLHLKFGIKRIVVSTYQSVTGTGVKALNQMENERKGITGEMAYLYPIDKNCIPQIDVFLDNLYTKEEMKMVNETRKILDNQTINITSTCVRIPVIGGHSESLNIEFERNFSLPEIRETINSTKGVILQDDPFDAIYPMPINSQNKDEVFVGRVRLDESQPNTVNMWIVADNLRKGAATNAIQIAELLLKNHIINV